MRELVMLAVLLALGSGPASFLGPRFDPAMRVAMAPVLGLCAATCVFTTLIWFTAARHTYWLIPILAVLSLAVALRRGLAHLGVEGGPTAPSSRFGLLMKRLQARDAVALLAICVVVAAPQNYTLHERHSVGPTGFEVWDAFAFTSETDGEVQEPIRTAWRKANTFGQNFAQMYWAGTALLDQNIDATPLSANVNELIGLGSTDTQSLFMVVFLVVGALGAFAAVRYAVPKPFWAAPLAGILFAGPFFLQLLADGSQPSLCGLAVILPIAAVGADALRTPRLASLVLLALLASGLMALYPLFVPAIAIAAAITVIVVGAMEWRRGRLNRGRLLLFAGAVAAIAALSVVFDLVAFLRDVRYWRGVLEGGWYLPGLPQYHLPFSVLPGWLLQTREFYSLTDLGHASLKELFIAVLLPTMFIAVILFGLRRRPAALALAGLILICAVMGVNTSAVHHCSYCTDRALLPIAPVSIGLLVLGIAALATAPSRWLRWLGIAVAIVTLLAVGQRTREERMRFANGGYYLEAGNRALLSHLPANAGSVDLEAYGQEPGRAPGELQLIYMLAYESNHGHVSLPSEFTDYSGLAYLTNANPRNPQFNPDYRYVLTRLAGVQNTRRVLARTGSVALEERASPLDVTLVSGVALPLERLDPQGLAWVEGPLHMLVVGGGPGPAWISLRFSAIVPVAVPAQSGVIAHPLPDGGLAACVRATGRAPVRKGTITLSFSLLPGIVPDEPFAVAEPPQGVQLVEMSAGNHCPLTTPA